MAQPTPYEREYNFTSFQAANPTTTLPAPHVDAELNRIKLTTDEIAQNLALIQRDDGALVNGIVTADSLGEDVLQDFEDIDAAATAAAASASSAAVSASQAISALAQARGFGSFYIVKNYSNNGTDDDVRFAIDAAHTAGGGIVFDHASVRDIRNTIEIPSGVIVDGAGRDATIWKAKNGLDADIVTTEDTAALWDGDSADGAQYWGMRNISIDGNKANNDAGCGIRSYSRAFLIEDVKVTYCKEKGVALRWGSNDASWDDDDDLANDPFMEPWIKNLFVGYNDEEGLYYDGAHDGRILGVLAALNSHTTSGAYDGIYVGTRAGGLMATMCHSWGETQRYAWNIEASSTHFANCEADDGYTALIRINGSDCTWVGGTQIGGFLHTPPSTLDKNLKGFVFGPYAYRPHIVTTVRNCPNGAIDFTNVGNLGGFVSILGALDAALLTANTGQATYGFLGTIPSTFDLNIDIRGVGNNFGVKQASQAMSFLDGTASFPSVRRQADITTGMFFAANKVGFAVGGTERFSVGPDYARLPRLSDTPATTWAAGMIYFDTTLNKARVYDGSAWQNLW